MKRITEAVIYDMDGVIADTQRIHSRIESEMLAGHGITLSAQEITLRFSGMSLREQFKTLFTEAGRPCPDLEAESERKVKLFHASEKEIEGIPGTLANIESLHGRLPLGVASASRPYSIELVLNKLSIRDRFAAVTSAREVARGKPAPDVFLLAAKKLGVLPENCLVVEDGISGMLGAKAAGMRCIALWNNEPRELPADLVVKDMRDVPLEWFS